MLFDAEDSGNVERVVGLEHGIVPWNETELEKVFDHHHRLKRGKERGEGWKWGGEGG